MFSMPFFKYFVHKLKAIKDAGSDLKLRELNSWILLCIFRYNYLLFFVKSSIHVQVTHFSASVLAFYGPDFKKHFLGDSLASVEVNLRIEIKYPPLSPLQELLSYRGFFSPVSFSSEKINSSSFGQKMDERTGIILFFCFSLSIFPAKAGKDT